MSFGTKHHQLSLMILIMFPNQYHRSSSIHPNVSFHSDMVYLFFIQKTLKQHHKTATFNMDQHRTPWTNNKD